MQNKIPHVHTFQIRSLLASKTIHAIQTLMGSDSVTTTWPASDQLVPSETALFIFDIWNSSDTHLTFPTTFSGTRFTRNRRGNRCYCAYANSGGLRGLGHRQIKKKGKFLRALLKASILAKLRLSNVAFVREPFKMILVTCHSNFSTNLCAARLDTCSKVYP